jgi:hypothetical protein
MTASPARSIPEPPVRSGLVTFAGVMLLLAGAFNLLDGIVAIVNDDYYVVDELLFGSLSAWGWWWLFMGSALLVTGLMVVRRNSWGAMLGIFIAGANALTHLMFLGARPGWSIAILVVDGLIIYALCSRADEFD